MSSAKRVWPRVRLMRCLDGLRDGTHGTYERVSDGVPFLSAKNVMATGVVIGDESCISTSDADAIVASGYPRKNDVLLTIVGTVGRSTVYGLPESLPFQRSVAFLRAGTAMEPRYLNYQLASTFVQGQMALATKTSAQPGLYLGAIAGLEVHVPPRNEQQVIADHLDRETARIDTLIEEQQRLIEMLRERRTALLRSQLDSIEGDRIRLGWFARIGSGDGIDVMDVTRGAYVTGDIGVIGGNGRMGWCRQSNVDRTVVVVGRVGALCGNVHRVDAPAWVTDNALRLDDLRDFDVDYLVWMLTAMNLNAISRSTAQPLITGSQVASLRVPCPPLDEQKRISSYLDDQTAKIDQLLAETERFIELSKERRAALITAAVTGQIDVGEVA